MELRDYLALTRRWWWLILVCTLVGGAAAYAAKQMESPEYRAEATLLVRQTNEPGAATINDILTEERLADTYRQIALSRPVLEDAQASLQLPGGVDSLQAALQAERVPGTQLIERLRGHSSNPGEAADIVNSVLEAAIDRNAAGDLGQLGFLRVVEPAVPPTTPTNAGNGGLFVVLGFVAGGTLAAGLVLAFEHLDERVRDPDRMRRLGVPMLGAVRRVRRKHAGLAVDVTPGAPEAEEYRVVRTAIQFALLDRPWRSLLVTSAGAGEGKTTVAVNLAVAAARAGQRVVAVDADLRRPALHRMFNVENHWGLTDLLRRIHSRARDHLQPTAIDGCRVLTAGPPPLSPDEVLGSSRLREVLDDLASEADVVIVDGPPVLQAALTGYLAHAADGTVLVVNARRTRQAEAARAIAALNHAGAHLVGVILGQAEPYEAYGYYGPTEHQGTAPPRNGAAST